MAKMTKAQLAALKEQIQSIIEKDLESGRVWIPIKLLIALMRVLEQA